jgi:hypothetical protein
MKSIKLGFGAGQSEEANQSTQLNTRMNDRLVEAGREARKGRGCGGGGLLYGEVGRRLRQAGRVRAAAGAWRLYSY